MHQNQHITTKSIVLIINRKAPLIKMKVFSQKEGKLKRNRDSLVKIQYLGAENKFIFCLQ